MLWVPGDMMSIMAAGIVMVMWYQQEEEKEMVQLVEDQPIPPDGHSQQ